MHTWPLSWLRAGICYGLNIFAPHWNSCLKWSSMKSSGRRGLMVGYSCHLSHHKMACRGRFALPDSPETVGYSVVRWLPQVLTPVLILPDSRALKPVSFPSHALAGIPLQEQRRQCSMSLVNTTWCWVTLFLRSFTQRAFSILYLWSFTSDPCKSQS